MLNKNIPPSPYRKAFGTRGVNYKNCSSTVQNTVYGPWVLSGAKWGCGGVSPARGVFALGGVVGESRFDFLLRSRRKVEIFLVR